MAYRIIKEANNKWSVVEHKQPNFITYVMSSSGQLTIGY